jgi:hypothetical protein
VRVEGEREAEELGIEMHRGIVGATRW